MCELKKNLKMKKSFGTIAQVKVVEAQEEFRKENCHQDAIKQTIKPEAPQQTTFGILVM